MISDTIAYYVLFISASRAAADIRQQSPWLFGRVGRQGAEPEQHDSRLQEPWQAENGITVDTKQWWVVVEELWVSQKCLVCRFHR